jgi:hypothetical protein
MSFRVKITTDGCFAKNKSAKKKSAEQERRQKSRA